MTPSQSEPPLRWQLIAIILMSVGLGTLLMTVLDKVLREESFIWYLLLTVLFVFAISANAIALLKRIP
jgi:hypothetical protein